MPDTSDGREKQARDRENRQREREILEELERWSEPEPAADEDDLDDLESDLEAIEFPATGADVVAAVGERRIESDDGTYAVADVVPETAAVRFETSGAVRLRVQRATVAAAMKRIYEAVDTLPSAELRGSRRNAYERTLRELESIAADDENEGIEVVTDWIVERIRENEALPGSRAIRRRAAAFCRANDYEVRNDEWLGA